MKLFIKILLLLFSTSVYSQVITIRTKGDTVNQNSIYNTTEIGFKQNATLGIDSFLTEIAIDSGTYNIYSIQREMGDFDCVYLTQQDSNLYFPNTINLSKDFRSATDVFNNNLNFQIKIKSALAKEIEIVDLKGKNLFETLKEMIVIRSCGSNDENHWIFKMENFGFDYSSVSYTSNGNTQGLVSYILIKFRDEALVLDKGAIENSIQIHVQPNPVSDKMTLPSSVRWSRGSIIDSYGKEAMSFEKSTHDSSIDVSYLPPGVYYLRLFQNSGHPLSCKVVKI